MIKVDTEKLKILIDLLAEIQNKYEDLTFNSFNNIISFSEYWQDERANLFYNKITCEKRITEKVVYNLKKRVNIYEYVYRQYAIFGKKINCDLKQKEPILNKFTYALEQLDGVIKRFNNLDLSFNFEKRELLLEQKKRVIQLRKEWGNYLLKIKKFFEQVELIEMEVKRTIQSIDDMAIEPFVFE